MNDNNTKDQLDEPITKTDLVNLIDFEINRAETLSSKEGHTKWAMVVSLVTMVWMFLTIVELNVINWDAFASLYLGLSFFPFVLIPNNDEHYSNFRSDRFYDLGNMFGAGAIWLAACICHIISLIYIIIYLSLYVVYIYLCFLILLVLLCLLLFLAVLLGILIKKYWPKTMITPVKTSNKIADYIIKSFAVISLVFYSIIAVDRILGSLQLNMQEWKMAFLACGIFYIFFCLLQSTISHVKMYVQKLAELRRKILLGNSSFSDAKDTLDLLINGLSISELIKPTYAKFVKLNSILNDHSTR